MSNPDGIAVRDDGSLLLVSESDPTGVFIARRGDTFDPGDAFSTSGPPFQSPDGIAVGRDGTVYVSDAAVLAMSPSGGLRPLAEGEAFLSDPPAALAWSPEGRLLVYENGDSGSTRIVEVSCRGTVSPLVAGIPDRGGMAVHPETRDIYFGLQNTLREIWRVPAKGGEPIVFVTGFDARTQGLAFSRDGRSLFVSTWQRVVEITGPFARPGEVSSEADTAPPGSRDGGRRPRS